MKWDVSEGLAWELGDQGPWIRYLKDAWRSASSVANEEHRHRPLRNVESGAEHEKRIAHWAPLFHPLMFGLGWIRPDIGLANWRDHGYPVGEPILRSVTRWWGKHGIEDLLAEAATSDVHQRLEDHVTKAICLGWTGRPMLHDHREWSERRSRRGWQSCVAEIHWDHLVTPVTPYFEGPTSAESNLQLQLVGDAWSKGHTALFADTYAGWYRTLAPMTEAHVDVVCRPVGWLGTYKRSPNTGIWHRAEEHWHMLGFADANG